MKNDNETKINKHSFSYLMNSKTYLPFFIVYIFDFDYREYTRAYSHIFIVQS